jgi:nucleoid DNA-binding protein
MIIIPLLRALSEEPSVVISGLGSFFVKHVNSQIREDIVYPPNNIVGFEFSKDVEDFNFVSKLSQWEQIRIDEAQAKISAWVELIMKGIEENHSVFLDDFGTFSKDSTGKIAFQGMIIPQLNIEYEGLEPVILPQKDDDKKDEPIKDKRIVFYQKKGKRDRILFVIVIFIAIAVLPTLFFKEELSVFFHKLLIKEKSIEIPSNAVQDDKIFEDEKLQEETLPKNIPSDEKLSIETAKEEVSKGSPPISLPANKELYLSYQKGNFYIIAGSFTKEESALLHIQQKKLDKYNAKLMVHSNSPRIRVCIGVFDNEEEASNHASQLDKNYWVLK